MRPVVRIVCDLLLTNCVQMSANGQSVLLGLQEECWVTCVVHTVTFNNGYVQCGQMLVLNKLMNYLALDM